MDYSLKRPLQLEDLNKLINNAIKNKKNRETGTTITDNNNEKYDCQRVTLEHTCVDKSRQKKQKQSVEMRLEVNRKRAKKIRKRKKLMVEDMQRQIVLLTTQNKQLLLEGHIQREEITFLRKTSQSLASNHRPITGTGVPQTTFSDSDILKIMAGARNTNGNLAGIRRAPIYPENFTFNAGTSLQHNTLVSPMTGLVQPTLQHTMYPFGA